MITAFPKIFAIGTHYIRDIFEDDVEVSEKIDGSQMSFGKVGGELFMRSKGAQLHVEAPQKMFQAGIDHVMSIESKLPDDTVFYCEYLQKEKHNVLEYERIPTNHLSLFAVCDPTGTKFEPGWEHWADRLSIGLTPVLYRGKIEDAHQLLGLLEKTSYLGGHKIEGVVCKNYTRPFLLGGHPVAMMAGKFVSEEYKEKHNKGKPTFSSKGKFNAFCDSFCTEARWQKAVQHCRDDDVLINAPQDIGMLIKEIQADIKEEEEMEIKKFLWKEFSGQIFRSAIRGFPEWYKKQLLEGAFDGKATEETDLEEKESLEETVRAALEGESEGAEVGQGTESDGNAE
jgi:hypothetical protein